MTEKNLWKHLRKRLHNPPADWLAYKVQDAYVKGLPDVVGLRDGVTYWLELKTLDHAPVRASTPWRVGVTAEQNRWLYAWSRARGHAYVLLYVERSERIYFLTPSVPEEITQENFDTFVVASCGDFSEVPLVLKRLFRGQRRFTI